MSPRNSVGLFNSSGRFAMFAATPPWHVSALRKSKTSFG